MKPGLVPPLSGPHTETGGDTDHGGRREGKASMPRKTQRKRNRNKRRRLHKLQNHKKN